MTLFLLAGSFNSFGQIGPNLGQTDSWMKSAVAAMERNDYQAANGIFRNLIDSGLPLPEEMPYYFAETLFQLGQYDNSANFLNKYLELSGFTGDHYKGAQELQKKLEGPLHDIQSCQLCDRKGYRYKVCFTCDGNKQIEQECSYCKAKGVVGCSRCGGTGMITKKNIFNIVEYFECERCSGKGRLTCPVCNASLKEVSACRTCGGSGRLASEVLCDHKAEEEHTH
ncbi:molecular chaperone DnaJ [Algoriphagus sp. YJ13C]|uniref:Molecular chaperone DnaJ n=1 Tax=Algoriphagus pacificus TaxID=2811234 RepID=A0ABS3CIA5_9BACT|nr:molecular chaperone DnaJ [Algoriphagus pacificus]